MLTLFPQIFYKVGKVFGYKIGVSFGRVNRHDDEFVHIHQTLSLMVENEKANAIDRENQRTLSKDVEELKKDRKNLVTILWKILMAAAGLSTILDHFPDLINKVIGK